MIHVRICRTFGALMISTAAIAAPAFAQSIDAPPSVTVSYTDLNIHQPAGAAVLFRRIKAAAEEACGGAPDQRLLNQLAAFDECRRAAVGRAVADVNEPLVTEAGSGSGSGMRLANR